MSVEMNPCHLNHLISTGRQHSAWAAPSASGGMGVDWSRRARCISFRLPGHPKVCTPYVKRMYLAQTVRCVVG